MGVRFDGQVDVIQDDQDNPLPEITHENADPSRGSIPRLPRYF